MKRALKKSSYRWRRRFRACKEGIRTLLLVLLAAALVVQGGLLYSRVTQDASSSKETKSITQSDSSAGAMPIRFATRNDAGELYGLEYNADGMREVFETTADVWAQAWENAEELETISVGQYRLALQQQMMLLEYDGSIPVSLAASWVGGTASETLADCTLGSTVLCRSGETYLLYIRDNTDGTIRRAVTQVEDAVFILAQTQYSANDCVIAADEDAETVSPDVLYFPGGETFEVMSFGTYDGISGMEEILSALGMEAETAMASAYDADGMTIYVSGQNTARLTQDNVLCYTGSSITLTGAAQGTWKQQAVQRGYEIAQAAVDALESGASVALTNAYTEKESGHYVAVFGLQVGGVPVDNTMTGYFARFEFTKTNLCAANIALRTMQTTGETIAIIPERQVAAALNSVSGAQISLRYLDRPTSSDAVSADSTDSDLWNAEDSWGTSDTDSEETEFDASEWDDALSSDTGDFSTAWYDSTGTAVSPEWYILRYGTEDELPDITKTLSPEEIVVVRADFDELIAGGAS